MDAMLMASSQLAGGGGGGSGGGSAEGASSPFPPMADHADLLAATNHGPSSSGQMGSHDAFLAPGGHQPPGPSSGSSGRTLNAPLLAGLLACLLAQLLKPFMAYRHDQGLNLHKIIGSGGMPSSHSSLVCAMTAASAIVDGFSSTQFAIGVVLSLIVMYDATGVRRQAGYHAMAINTILRKSAASSSHGGIVHRAASANSMSSAAAPSVDRDTTSLVGGMQALFSSSLQVDLEAGEYSVLHGERTWPIPLNESVGHTPPQVATGAALGVLTGLIVGLAAR